ncbi:hypothetical protein SFRURICE_009778 [Spodoptera frugiperda]|nr:hypothetical protein SFRURICE_009778 [Spodoptera frugiperda]
MRVLVFVVTLFTSSLATQLSIDEIEELFRKRVRNELTELESQKVDDLMELFRRQDYLTKQNENERSSRMSLDCAFCRAAFSTVFEYVHNNQSEQATQVITNLCTSLGIQSYVICKGAIELNVPILIHIIETVPEATPRAFCGLVLQNAGNPNFCKIDDPRFEWEVDLPEPMPETQQPDPIADTRPLRIAVITDAHIDPLYEANGVANCDQPVCCRVGQSPAHRYIYPIKRSIAEENLIDQSDAKETVRARGEYSMLVRPGLRVIAMNNNIAYKYNWWLVYDPLDAKKHLDWLVEELYKAEKAGEKVHILAHIPAGVSDLTQTWTREYNKIVNRFSKTIAAEFNGHTHSDEFKIFYSLTDGSPINVAWGAGSTTAFTFYNLNYKIIDFDSQTYLPDSIVNYVYNLTEANLTPDRPPHWFQLYDMKNTFGLPDLSAVSMDNLVHRMVTGEKHLLDKYAAFYSKVNDVRWSSCNDWCKIDNLCKTVVTVLWQRQKCDEIRNLQQLKLKY